MTARAPFSMTRLMNIRLVKINSLIGVFILASGCSLFQAETDSIEQSLSLEMRQSLWEARKVNIEKVQYWRAKGRIAVSSPKDNGNASLNWWQVRSAFDIRLSAPLGAGSVRLKNDSTGALLVKPNAETLRGASADSLLMQTFGWRIPLENLAQWMTGLPGESDSFELDDWGRIRELKQNGWTVTYAAYTDVGELALPQKIFMKNGDYSVRVALSTWDNQSKKKIVDNPVPEVKELDVISNTAKTVEQDALTEKVDELVKPIEDKKPQGKFKIPGVDL